MSKKVVTLLNKYGPMLSGELARKFEHEYGASNTAARQALSRAKKPVNKICTLSFDKNQKFFYLESQYMSNRYIERLMDAIKQSSQINWVYICAFQSQNGFVQLYNPQACKLAVRTILRQNDNNEIKGYDLTYFSKDETGVSLWLGQAKLGGKAYSKIEEVTPCFLPKSESNELVPIEKKVNDRIKNVVTYISDKHYGKTLLYCTTPAKAIEYSNKLSDNMGALRAFDAYPDDFKTFLSHIQKEYDIDHSVDEWSLIKVLQNGFGMHHGKLPKYIQQEILDQFNKGTFDVLFCTSTIVEGVNTDAQNMIILNASKGSKKLTPFDIKNIKGRAGRYYHCFIGRVFYLTKELQEIEDSDSMTLNFVTYSDNELSVIDLDNAEIEDLTSINAQRKTERETVTQQFVLPQEVFFKNRNIGVQGVQTR